jgi:diaminopimelate dehydrogenase
MDQSDIRKEPTRIMIVGYGNVGAGVLQAIENNYRAYGDIELAGIMSRRPDATLKRLGKVRERTYGGLVGDFDDIGELEREKADVAILCGGSKTDLPWQGPYFAHHVSTVDSFDNHNHIPEYWNIMNLVAQPAGNTSVISAGWDPGTFSVERVLGNAYLPGAKPGAFYGLTKDGGLSQGHSDAVRRISGVADARQYTHAIPATIKKVRSGENPALKPGDKLWREVYVVLENDNPEERDRVTKAIVNDKDYFADYKTTVNFVKKGELRGDMPHDGTVITAGETSNGQSAAIEYSNRWDSNPEATGHILVACARAAHRMNLEGKVGAITMLDITPAQYSPHSRAELLKSWM